MENKFREIEMLYQRVLKESPDTAVLVRYLLRIYYDLVILLSEASQLHFNTLFARISFIVTHYPVRKAWSFALQIPRREIHRREMGDQDLLPVVQACVEYLLLLCRSEFLPAEKHPPFQEPALPRLPPGRKPGVKKIQKARVVALEWDRHAKRLSILDEGQPDTTISLQYDVHGVNDIFTDTLELAINEIGLPLILGLTDIECTDDHVYIPSYIIIIPDLLLDVTAVAQMHTDGADPVALNILDLFLPSGNQQALFMGHIANFILDELVRDDTKSFDAIFLDAFKMFPVEFAGLPDEVLRGIQKRMKYQYGHILRVLQERFPVLGIERSQCMIEPSFFSPVFGIKGRLDLYYEEKDRHSASIIELKSSKPFRPNSYGLSHAHYHQTLLYDLLVRSSHAPAFKRSNFILYSEEAQDTLRYAVSVEAIQKEAMHNRNQLVLLQYRLMGLDRPDGRDIFKEIDPASFTHVKGFLQQNTIQWHTTYSALSPGEQAYIKSFTAFITREHMVARLGSERGDGTGGLAGLWLDSTESKENRYAILRQLTLAEVQKDERQTLLHFKRSDVTNPLANFRAGDIAVLYPYEPDTEADPTGHQLFRASIVAVDASGVTVRLRNMQVHTDHIERTTFWNIEHDLLDSSFRGLYQSLWFLMTAELAKRQIILGLVPPPLPTDQYAIPAAPELTPAQHAVFTTGIRAQSLFLLWGPPGTGKTSMMLKSWVRHYWQNTTARIALLAYTNRAVDEMCEALHDLGYPIRDQYIRIGSRAATGEAYRHRLLDQILGPMSRRSQIVEQLGDTRIFVGTVASLQGKSELFNLIGIDLAIIDEASQLLEPAVVGLLTRFKKTILIGDHMQLPAVAAQPAHLSQIHAESGWNQRLGLTDMSMSYFERMYRLYQQRGWQHAIGTLHEQGRMHADIMAFANRHIYQGILQAVDPSLQTAALSSFIGETASPLFSSRLVFIPSGATWADTYSKTNLEEGMNVLRVIVAWKQKLTDAGLSWSIGVITPFRAQIAAIQHLAYVQGVDLSDITVDTVERYQGGARDIIIMSCAVNSAAVLSRIISVNADGIDRKLNVAVTRARQQFILIGHEPTLRSEPAYVAILDMCARMESVAEMTVA